MTTERESGWAAVSRWHAYEGERRANLVRLVAIAAFYAVELAVYHGPAVGLPALPGVDARYHGAITAVCVAWVAVAVGVLLLLRSRRFPPALPFVVSALDVALLTAVLFVADGPRSPIVVAFFPVVALTALRTNLRLTRFTTVAAALGYLCVLGNARWVRPEFAVPRHEQALTLVAIVLTGVIVGQAVRRATLLASDFADRVADDRGADSEAPS